MSVKELIAIKTMVYKHCGLLLEGIAEDRLRKAVQANMLEASCLNLSDYRQLISKDSQAFNKLINQLTVNETYFFREPEQIQLLVEVLLPQIQAQKSPMLPIRILSAGCSSGEEPYSLAIALREALGETAAKRVQIDAGDLDYEILKKAQIGLYSDFSFRGVKPALRKRYFKPQTQGHQLVSEIRQLVNFHQLNLLAPVFPKQLGRYDVIFFRNVSIYFDLETRRLIQNKFYDLMNDDAILMLGSSETLGNDLGVFELVEQKHQYYFIKGEAYRPNHSLILPAATDHAPSIRMSEPSISASSIGASIAPKVIPKQLDVAVLPDLKNIQQLVVDGRQERALQLLNQWLATASKDPLVNLLSVSFLPINLLKSWLVLNNKDFESAEQLLNEALVMDPWSVDAMLMKGLSCKWQQQVDEAIQWFKKAVYTYPECWSAHYYLADIYRNEQQPEAAIRSYQTVLRILTANPDVSDGTQFIPLPLPAGHVLFLSQRHLQQLTASLQIARR